jgi:hypothetical protein
VLSTSIVHLRCPRTWDSLCSRLALSDRRFRLGIGPVPPLDSFIHQTLHLVISRAIDRRRCPLSLLGTLTLTPDLFIHPRALVSTFPLGTTPHADSRVGDEFPGDGRPGRVGRERVVEFVCEGVELGQAGPWDGGEVVVFVVVSDLARW